MLNKVLNRNEVEIDEVGWKVMLRGEDGRLHTEWGYGENRGLFVEEDKSLGSPYGPGFHVILSKRDVLRYYKRELYFRPWMSNEYSSVCMRHDEIGPNRPVIKKVYPSDIRGYGKTFNGEVIVLANRVYIPSLKSLAAKTPKKEKQCVES